jgi:hypothetical protein
MDETNTFLRKHVSMDLLEVSLSCLHYSHVLIRQTIWQAKTMAMPD